MAPTRLAMILSATCWAWPSVLSPLPSGVVAVGVGALASAAASDIPVTDEIVPVFVCIGGGTVGMELPDCDEDGLGLKDERMFCAEDLRRMAGRVTSEKLDIASPCGDYYGLATRRLMR